MDKIERPTWDEIFPLMTAVFSSKGSCDRLRTACILVKNKKIVGAGYNGAVAGLDNCDEVGHLMIDNHCARTIHGEDNAVNNAVADLDGATAYIIATPCLDCVKNLLQKGIKRIVYIGSYANSKGLNYIESICKEKSVMLEHFSDPRILLTILRKVLNRLRGPGGIFKDIPEEELFLLLRGGDNAAKQ